jgi:GNAT superfamily N-acetyltransferase
VPPHIERIDHKHDCGHLKCGDNTLDVFLKKFALNNDRADLGITYVAVMPGERRVVGFYTLSTAQVNTNELPDGDKMHFKSIGVVLLGRLAVDRRHKRKGIGGRLLIHALKTAEEISQRGGAYALIVHASKTDEALGLYAKYKFEELKVEQPGNQVPMFLSMRKVRDALAEARSPEAASQAVATMSSQSAIQTPIAPPSDSEAG